MKFYNNLSNFKGGDVVFFAPTDDYYESIVRLPLGFSACEECLFTSKEAVVKDDSNWHFIEDCEVSFSNEESMLVRYATEDEIKFLEDARDECIDEFGLYVNEVEGRVS
jgi:hypothetical protein